MAAPRKPTAVLKFPKQNDKVPEYCTSIVSKIRNSRWFQPPNPAPDPTLASVEGLVTAFETAQINSRTRAPGTAAALKEARNRLETSMGYLKV